MNYEKLKKMKSNFNVPRKIFEKHIDDFSKKYKGSLEAPNKLKKPLMVKMPADMAFEVLYMRGELEDYLGVSKGTIYPLPKKQEENLANKSENKKSADDSRKGVDKGTGTVPV